MGTFKGYWDTWLWRTVTLRIITISTIAWLVISAGLILMPHWQQGWIGLFAVPSQIGVLPMRIWTPLSYMFSHIDFLHLLVNMMWLMLFGRLLETISTPRRYLSIYIGGGLCGAAAFVIANLIHQGPYPYMLGASCAVASVIGAVAVVMCKWRVNLFIFGEVKVVWVAIVAVAFIVLTEPALYISIAHCVGLAFGVVYGLCITKGFRLHFARPAKSETDLDQLLAKVSRSGYASLSAAERQRLFQLSQRIKK